MKIVIYNEHNEHHTQGDTLKSYPNGIHGALEELFKANNHEVKVFTHKNINNLTKEDLDDCDVMVWWGHMMHWHVEDSIVDLVCDSVLKGMGFIALHSSHLAKPFKKLMGTSCTLKWREIGEKERVWVVDPQHEIAKGLNEYFEIPHEEMYGEHFDIPTPDELVFIGWFAGGEVFRSGCCYKRGYGKVFYFQPGHETNPVYYQKDVQQVLLNAVNWAKPNVKKEKLDCPNITKPLENI